MMQIGLEGIRLRQCENKGMEITGFFHKKTIFAN